MTFIRTISEESAKGNTAEMYARVKGAYGYLPNFIKAFSYRPDVLKGFDVLLDSIKSNMDVRRYELVTIAAAKELKSSYCMLAHGSILMRDHYDSDEFQVIAENPEKSILSEVDKAIMSFAGKVVRDATSITDEDVDQLRQHGLAEDEIFDITTAATVRCFISKTADAMGARPDSVFNKLDADLKRSLVVGRPIAE